MFDLIPGAAGLNPQSIPDADIVSLASALLAQGCQCHQRRMLLLAGEAEWCRKITHQVLALPELSRATWVSSDGSTDGEVVDARSVKGLLGQERDAVIFDAHSGFDPDAFGAVSGVIRGGGLLILLCPPLSKWEYAADPASERIAISPYTCKDISGRFIRRLVKVFREADGVCLVEQGRPLPTLNDEPNASPGISSYIEPFEKVFRTADQQAAVEAIKHVVHGHRRRPVVLVSDRGRGKTSALGIASAQLIQDAATRQDHSRGFVRILVTAPRRNSVEALFAHAQQLLPGAERNDNSLQWQDSQIQFIAPDILSDSQESADLVLVDEAAAIPSGILSRLLENYSRIVFSTTVHGYEGTGRGFAIRFRQTLDEKTPGWREVLLKQPVRWADNDPLEKLVFNALLLDADGAQDEAVTGVTNQNVVIECLERDALVEDEQTLSQLFGLLVSAHYQTSPNDLRNMLDGPGVSVYVMRSSKRGQVVATALVSSEGEFSDELADAILSGQRRPRGHLIPQSLMAHLGIRQAAALRCARIMRIAVHPAVQRKGFGRQLIEFIKSETENNGYHLFGTSFGATTDLLKFWKSQGMVPVRVGFRRDHASGEHSVMMLTSIDTEGAGQGAEVVRIARERFCNDLPHWLSDSLHDLDSSVAMELLCDNDYQSNVSDDDLLAVKGFAEGARSYEDCSAELWRFSLFALSRNSCITSHVESTVLIAKVIQKCSWQEAIRLCGVSGRNEVITLLRSAVSNLLNQCEIK